MLWLNDISRSQLFIIPGTALFDDVAQVSREGRHSPRQLLSQNMMIKHRKTEKKKFLSLNANMNAPPHMMLI